MTTLNRLYINGCGLRCARTAQYFSLFLENKAEFGKSGDVNRRPVLFEALKVRRL